MPSKKCQPYRKPYDTDMALSKLLIGYDTQYKKNKK